MGDCLSRPSEELKQSHLQKISMKNNSEFLASSIVYNRKLLSTYPPDSISKLIKDLEDEQIQLFSKIENSTAGMPSIPEVTIEVQQGFDLHLPGCFDSSQPVIKISLEENGPSFTTAAADKYLPEWFKVVKIKQSLTGFTKIRINLMLKKDDNEFKFLNKCDFLISDLDDQMVREGWYNMDYPVPDNPGMQPRLRLRIQLIHNENALYTELIKQANERIDELSSHLPNIKKS